MPDHRADRAVIGRGIVFRVEIRRLQDRGGEVERVLQRQIDRVHRLRGHPPFGAVGRLAELADLVAIDREIGALQIADRVLRVDRELGEGAPMVGIADADIEHRQLAPRLGLGPRGHPVELLDALVERADDVLDHRLDLGLRLRREIARGVEPTDLVTECRIDRRDAALVARLLRGGAVELLAVEGEARIVERLGEHRGCRGDAVRGQPVLPVRERLACDEARKLGDGVGLPGDEVLLARRDACRCPVRCPVEPRGFPREVGAGPGVIALARVLACLDVGLCGGDLHFEREDARGAGRRIAQAREAEDLRQIGFVALAQLGHLRGLRQIIVAVGEAEAALHQIRRVALGLVEILRDEQAEQIGRAGVIVVVERVGIGTHLRAHHLGQRRLVAQCIIRRDERLERCDAARFDGSGVVIRGVIVGDQALAAAGCGVRLGGVLDDRRVARLGDLGDLDADAGRRAGWLDLGGLAPRAIGVIVEIVARLDALVDQRGVDARLRADHLRRDAGGDRRAGEQCDRKDGEAFHQDVSSATIGFASRYTRSVASANRLSFVGADR